jgi:hypothetical protein
MENEHYVIDFVACPNPDHVGKEGWESRQLYYAGNGIYKCDSCGKELTREEVENEIQKEHAHKLLDLQRSYQQSIAEQLKNRQDNLDKLKEIEAGN